MNKIILAVYIVVGALVAGGCNHITVGPTAPTPTTGNGSGGTGSGGNGNNGGGGTTTPNPGGGTTTPTTTVLQDLQALRDSLKGPDGKRLESLSSLCTNPTGLEPPSCPLGTWLNKVAWDHRAEGWVLSGKSGGHRVQSPAGEIAGDILGKNGQVCDVISDAENTAGIASGLSCGAPPAGRPFVNPVQP